MTTARTLTRSLGLSFVAAVALVLSGCEATRPVLERIEAGEASPQEMYNFAQALYEGEKDIPTRAERNGVRLVTRLDWAAYIYDLIERFYPANPLAAIGQLRQGEAMFEEGDYKEAAAEMEEFILEHPGHHLIDQAYYIIAMTSFVQIKEDGLDPGDTFIAIKQFERLLKERPNTQYRQEAEQRILAARTQLASTEVRLGRTLQREKNFQGAIARYLRVVEEFDTTAYVEEALYRIVESYLSLGLRSEAQSYGTLLGHNYPDSEWYAQAYALLTGQTRPSDGGGGLFGGLFN